MNYTDDPEYQGLLRRILEEPGEDLHRLVLCDWLEERGDRAAADHAEFILCSLDGAKSGVVAARRRELFPRIPKPMWNCWDRWAPDDALTPYALFTRGFVSEVRLTLREFVGGECHNCESNHERGMDAWDCSCHGTGRTPGLAENLFREQPIERLVLTDREPSTDSSGFYWQLGNLEYPSSAPMKLFEAEQIPMCRLHTTRQAALDALSIACVAYGRQLAGLPPLTSARTASAGSSPSVAQPART